MPIKSKVHLCKEYINFNLKPNIVQIKMIYEELF